MSVTISNCDQICHSPTNLSKAKMLYTFKKQTRFPKKMRVLCDKFYNLPEGHIRSTSLGYGHKYDFTKDQPKSPSPNTYEISSEFQTQNSKKKGVGFGGSRQQMAITGPFTSCHKNKNPGPGNYQIKSYLNNTSYSMGGKNIVEDRQKLRTPGPGTYSTSCELSPNGKYFLAKHKNSCVRNFANILKRGSTIHCLATPGPGRYNLGQQNLSPQGKYFVSKMHNSLARKFGSSIREPLAPNNITPGPGSYKLPSEFGYYLAKNAVIPEKQKQNSNKQQYNKQNKQNHV